MNLDTASSSNQKDSDWSSDHHAADVRRAHHLGIIVNQLVAAAI
ncbi:hypothetical protein AVEN_272100-1, partial [Araneus ventricosus]